MTRRGERITTALKSLREESDVGRDETEQVIMTTFQHNKTDSLQTTHDARVADHGTNEHSAPDNFTDRLTPRALLKQTPIVRLPNSPLSLAAAPTRFTLSRRVSGSRQQRPVNAPQQYWTQERRGERLSRIKNKSKIFSPSMIQHTTI
jgi:hypothetical protein